MAKVLVIDDEDELRRVFRQILEREGHDVTEASNGNIGIKEYRKNQADVVIMDMIMPEKEGVETMRELKREFSDIKIIAVSGGGSIGTHGGLLAAISLGAQYAFMKPVNMDELIHAVQDLACQCRKET